MTPLSRSGLAGLLLVTTALATGHAFAQTPIALGEVVVEADAEGNAIVTTTAGSKLAVAITEVPQSVSVVNRAQLDANPGAKATEVLRYTAGVSPSTYGTDADTDWMFVRGFQAEQTGVFLDNLPLYQYGFGTFLIDPFLLESIEVLKGPSSALYGGGNVGGVVNYVGKRPTGERLIYTEAGVNNFGNAYTGFDIGDSLGDGAAAYRVTGKIAGGGYENDYSEDLRGDVLGSVRLSPTADTDLTIYAAYQNIDLTHTSTGFLPYVGTVVDAPGGVRIPRDLYYGEPGYDEYDRQQAMIGYELEHDLNGNWTVRQNVRYATVDLAESYVYAGTYPGSPLVGTELSRIAFSHDTKVGTLSIDNQLEGNFETGPLRHKLLVGLDYKNYSIDQLQGSASVDPLNIYDPEYGATIPPLFYYNNSKIDMQQLGVYAQDQIRLDDFIVTLNGRYDWVDTEFENRLASTTTDRSEGNFTGRVGLGYEFDNGLTPYLSYGTSFNPSIATSFSGELLESEHGEQWEAGIKYEPTGFDGLIAASVFHITRSNFLGPDPANVGFQLALGEVDLRGAELEGVANLGDFTVRGALTYLEAEAVETAGTSADPLPIGNSPVQIPKLTASLAVDYTFPDGALEGLTIGAGIRHLGESWADNANTARVPSATLLDATLRYERDDWAATLAASNILDTTYVASCQGLYSCGYGAGRTVTLSLSKKW